LGFSKNWGSLHEMATIIFLGFASKGLTVLSEESSSADRHEEAVLKALVGAQRVQLLS
jgi:hypothetical protein